MNTVKLLSEFGRGKDKKKRFRKPITTIKNRITGTPGDSTLMTAQLGMYGGMGVGGVLGIKALDKLNKSNILKNNALSTLGAGAILLGTVGGGTLAGIHGGMKFNSKVRKKSMYE